MNDGPPSESEAVAPRHVDTQDGRQAFLLRLSDALRSSATAAEAIAAASRMIGERLEASRIVFADIDRVAGLAHIRRGWTAQGAESCPEALRLADFSGPLFDDLSAGRTVRYEDVGGPPYARPDLAALAAMGIRAGLSVPLLVDGRLAFNFNVHQDRPRHWTDDEVSLVEDVAERLWFAIGRARAEEELRASEEKYRTLFEGIDEGFTLVEIIFDDDGVPTDILHLEANQAYSRYTGLYDIVGKRAREIVPDGGPWLEFYGDVARTGQSARLETYMPEPIDRWISSYASRMGGAGSRKLAIVFNDITERKRTEQALRESEERQAFLLKLSDALRSLSDPEAIRGAAVHVLGEHLGVNRAAYVDLWNPLRDDTMSVTHIYNKGVRPWIGDMSVADYGAILGPAFTAGQTAIVRDIENDPLFADAIETYREAEIGAAVAVPIVKGGRYVAVMGVHNAAARNWTPLEIALIEDVANRTWEAVERAQAEAALRESEERFTQFANASASGLWIRDAANLTMEYVSPAIAAIYGVEPDAILGDVQKWAAMIVPEDRDVALAHIASAGEGETVVHEFRIQRQSDQAFRWIRNTDFPLDANGHIQRIGGIAEDVSEEKLATEHQVVLLAELQHRVRNIMAIIRSIVARTAASASSIDEYVELLSGRLLTLARVQALLTRAADAKVGIAAIVQDELAAQATHAGQFDALGPDVLLSAKAAETMTLVLHELATNALKYGALSAEGGKVMVRWDVVERRSTPWLSFDWTEAGAPIQDAASGPRRTGFGSELIEGRVPYELSGRGALTIAPGGAHCHMEFPLKEGASVLETDAPQRANVFGGAIDMRGQADLTGQRVLVVEDDYYLASDAARALKGAGAEVIGPCPTEDSARAEMQGVAATCAVLDINLRGGRSFDLARELKRDGLPFVFITGYDQEVVPDDLADVKRLQKPVHFKEIVGALAELLDIAR